MAANAHGDFVWYELMSGDPDESEAFYAKLLGWEFKRGGSEGENYRPFSFGEVQVGGFLTLTEDMAKAGMSPAWVGYIQVDDVPAAVGKARKHGGSVLMEGGEVPDVGPFAMVTDPQGAPFYLINDLSGEPSHAFSKHEPHEGTCAWNELATSEPIAALDFYRDMFGWTKDSEMEMGPLGTYTMFRHGDYMPGAVYKMVAEDPSPHWLFYFRVPDIAAAAKTIVEHGGSIHIDPMEIPGGEFSLTAHDPQGAFFGLIGPKGS